ncbi:uncharacterized protein EKO05_0010390 [Ascochyta rabiei]|uniref:Uncharacterized protein n=1 Tax=Didymella rabiei TaxID=5454 RepID=A0A162W9C1_DIDRA|nr:uncharacterized protein EKO05_0010390 [Ascochyta rabiei]KZM18890.1 hypothetical protein ST47_g9965 [Ascochyta rabiei]UPX20148.1 hypothetical protein EKO05_0010390 [Ascochyta rabiei]
MTSTFRIVLTQDEGYDVHNTREFDVALGSKFTIGRASKNTSKGHLLPAKHNVYIDSPVVSREHAILTANTATGAPHVYVTDTKSMHGTFVNGTPLVPDTPKQLSNGDKLQFGVNVCRNDCYFVAYKYTFRAELSDPEPFSRGFTVPEAESEEEDVDYLPSGRGSQLNPLVLDDSDPESEHHEHSDSEIDGDVTMALLDEDEDAEDCEALISDDSQEEEGETADISIIDSDSESDMEGDAASTGSVSGHALDSPFVHEAHHIQQVEKITAIEQSQATPADQSYSSTTPSAPLEKSPTAEPFSYGDFEYPSIPDLPLPPFGTLSQNPESSMFDSALAPPLPPRPSEKRQKMWDQAPQQGYDEWLTEESHIAPVYSPAGFTEHAPLFRDVPAHASQQIKLPHFSSFSPERVPAYKPVADRMQTPPPTLTADVVSTTPPPPTRRTGVSITEIVEEQPPTPTSVNSRKRSADDAFEVEAEDNDEKMPTRSLEVVEVVTEPINETITPASDVPSVEQTTPLSQRPIAQPRSILKKALRAASLMVPATALGAAVSVVALTALPESFFTVA